MTKTIVSIAFLYAAFYAGRKGWLGFVPTP
jgi:hypothetical protein